MSVSIIASISGIWMYLTLALLSTRGKDRDRVCREIIGIENENREDREDDSERRRS